METDKPQISILLAVYDPRMDWLREQLLSLNEQTYPNLKLYVRDDCSPTVPYTEIESCVRECITAFPYEIFQNEHNLGSNKTFERLTLEADGEYFAYCDQDDVWLPGKIEAGFALLQESGAVLVCGDVAIIDGEGNKTADSITQIRKRHIFRRGADCLGGLLYRNFVIGCTSLLRAETAKAACPFLDSMVHDHWLAVYASSLGAIDYLDTPCMNYRQHGNNQTGVLTNSETKQAYYEKRILAFLNRIEDIAQRVSHSEIERARAWGIARKEHYLQGLKKWMPLFRMRSINKSTTLFELVMLHMPKPLFSFAVRTIQKGRL